MAYCSPVIRPLGRMPSGPGKLEGKPRTFSFRDDSTTIYPKLPNGQSCRVVIIRRMLASSHGATFHTCRNAGKWSYKISYPMKGKPVSVTKDRFLSELNRLGGAEHADMLFAAS